MQSGSKSPVVTAKRAIKTTLRVFSTGYSSEQGIVDGLNALGVRPGGIILVHSALSSLGYVPGGPQTVIRALRSVLGKNGTLLMPAHSWDLMEEGCRVFDARSTKSCVGQITEEFRTMPGVLRSLHPSHSVAGLGPQAADMLAGHEHCSSPCGSDTPYQKICRMNGQILFLGVTLDSNTAYHTVEAIAGLDYLMKPQADQFTIIDSEGRKQEVSVWRHEAGIARRFSEWESLLVKQGIVRIGKVGKARSLLMDAAPFLNFMMEAVHKDPSALRR